MNKSKKILLIISGGIAAYKILDLVKSLVTQNFEIKTILTKTAEKFITPLSVSSLSKNKIYQNKFEIGEEIEMDHIALSRWADLILIAPATANIISNIANGFSHDFVNTIILASDKKVFLAPAMNVKMWKNPATKKNVETIIKRNFSIIGPSTGLLACGEFGEGKMADINEIETTIKNYFSTKNIKLKAIVTAGPTREYIDPVRYLTNESSGLQGYHIAKKMNECGIDTKLIIGPTQIHIDDNTKIKRVISANDMFEAVKESLPVDIAVCTAAVADFKIQKNKTKIKKENFNLNLTLKPNIDILNFVSNHNKYRPKLVIGFAAETDNLIDNAKIKLKQKRCDWIIVNDITNRTIGFNSNNNEVSIIKKNNSIEKITKREKAEVASILVHKIIKNFSKNENKSIN
ncbi:MAG: bifunctional phosphopantothenoylcysteine decarboxylase/phosphopantothenate--cysteine ligase CoaBC [Candidatus Pelagibacter sp.]|nr:bifunctional phosphopantothenoylcysteine decarboxylase/phosphopantothenate--cysteine ligase CoaBC [Candidatus Pelagibacter sp.]|tara:strand:- start:1107 stop:2318 length:1212 start_codon:yes stop_codon:yes gene_type:complete